MDLSKLNEMQQKAVRTVDGPVLILAGAGSGKTSVLTNRIAYLIEECGVDPYNILALTFTNKAAQEMKERVERLVDADLRFMAISTFHSVCAKFLRYDAELLGYTNSFTIYDSDDSLSLIKRLCKDDYYYGIKPAAARHLISRIKNGLSSENEAVEGLPEELNRRMKRLFEAYNEELIKENAMDFDDLLLNMLRLLKENEGLREHYQERFRYVLVDEYQDTNRIQYELIRIISEKHRNIFVVGDDDQSIYGWRGANIENILNFEKDFPGAAVIKLEQNYRSHQKILDCANAVISRIENRKDKIPWSARTEGEKVKLYYAPNEYSEGEFIARKIKEIREKGIQYKNIAVLYRTHTQSRVIEEKLRMYGIPYRIYGGTSFFERKEVKDIIAYLTLINNQNSDMALLRIINVPRRGIGQTTITRLTEYAADADMSLFEACLNCDTVGGAAMSKITAFMELMNDLMERSHEMGPSELIDEIIERTDYRSTYEDEERDVRDARDANIEELKTAAMRFEAEDEDNALTEFLSSLSLITDTDTMDENEGVTLMTLHSSKGLEFDTVFISGLEEGLFPSSRSVDEGRIDEERRLCYVGITRAKDRLFLSRSLSRNMYGSGPSDTMPSRFIKDIPAEYLEDLSTVMRREKTDLFDSPRKETVRPGFSFRKKAEFVAKATENAMDFKIGDTVEHNAFGRGKIISISGTGDQRIATVQFMNQQRKLFLAFAPLKIVEDLYG